MPFGEMMRGSRAWPSGCFRRPAQDDLERGSLRWRRGVRAIAGHAVSSRRDASASRSMPHDTGRDSAGADRGWSARQTVVSRHRGRAPEGRAGARARSLGGRRGPAARSIRAALRDRGRFAKTALRRWSDRRHRYCAGPPRSRAPRRGWRPPCARRSSGCGGRPTSRPDHAGRGRSARLARQGHDARSITEATVASSGISGRLSVSTSKSRPPMKMPDGTVRPKASALPSVLSAGSSRTRGPRSRSSRSTFRSRRPRTGVDRDRRCGRSEALESWMPQATGIRPLSPRPARSAMSGRRGPSVSKADRRFGKRSRQPIASTSEE